MRAPITAEQRAQREEDLKAFGEEMLREKHCTISEYDKFLFRRAWEYAKGVVEGQQKRAEQ